MNKDVFHNQLALALGYERIVKDNSIDIRIDNKDNPDDPEVTVRIDGQDTTISFKTSQTLIPGYFDELCAQNDRLKEIVDAVHQACLQAMNNPY